MFHNQFRSGNLSKIPTLHSLTMIRSREEFSAMVASMIALVVALNAAVRKCIYDESTLLSFVDIFACYVASIVFFTIILFKITCDAKN